MRITPLAIWTYNLSDEEKYEAITHDVRMTHPNTVVHEANFLYCLAIQYMLKNHDSKTRCQDAFNHVLDIAA